VIINNSKLFSQQRNFNQFTLGLAYGFPSGDETKSLNNSLYKINLGQEFALNEVISIAILSDYGISSGKSANPDIEKIGLGGGFKIQIIPVIEAILKKESISKFNYFISGTTLLNLKNIPNYANSGQMFDVNVIVGLEFISKNATTYKVFYGGNYFYNSLSSNINANDTRLFRQFGVAVGFKNFSKQNK
jgi:hypothetical protein